MSVGQAIGKGNPRVSGLAEAVLDRWNFFLRDASAQL